MHSALHKAAIVRVSRAVIGSGGLLRKGRRREEQKNEKTEAHGSTSHGNRLAISQMLRKMASAAGP
jgi:hypothetical protein